ncbi:MAG: hypothetical protein K2Y22_04050 [Candidatus Obscuribacterales bacterium]|nr:hypothetical protein [Candidatus Obscuribacterales bacterium]
MDSISDNLLQTFLLRFANRFDVYAEQWTDGEKHGYKPIYQPVTTSIICAHILGQVTIGFYGHDLQSESRWLCGDSDVEDGCSNQLADAMSAHGWRVIKEGKRPGRDGHFWLFFDQPVPARALRRFARAFMRSTGIAENHLEIFPKQDKLIDLGNLVRGPLGIHRKPEANGCRGWFEGPERDIQSQLEWFASQRPNRADDLLSLVDELDSREITNVRTSSGFGSIRSRRGEMDWVRYAEDNGYCHDVSKPFWRGPCPACKLIRRDSDDNHLWISDTGAVGCWRGCSVLEIREAICGSSR